jgi:hypothetical protein
VTTLVIWLAFALALALAISLVTMLFVGRLARRRLPEVLERAGDGGREILRVAPMVQFFGAASAGHGQWRGNGTLVLNPDRLYFEMWAPRRELSIPLAGVTHVDTARGHLGKYTARPLLRIVWRSATGDDAAAWQLRDLDEWLVAVRSAAGLVGPPPPADADGRPPAGGRPRP